MIRFAPGLALIVASMFSSANLKAAATNDSTVITFPPSTAQKWVLPNGLTVIVQEDHSAPVASVQAWCATGSIDEDEHLGAGLSHILEHMLFKGTKTRSTNVIAQKIQDVGGYINAYTSFDRTVFWIDVPKDGVATALDVLADAMMNSTLPPKEYMKEQEVIRREFAMGLDDPDRVAGLLLFATAYQRHPYHFPVIGDIEIYNQLTQDQVIQYYKTRYSPNNLTFVVVGDVDVAKVRQQLTEFFKAYPEKSLKPIFIPEEPPQLGRREVHQEFATELTHLSLAWHIPEVTNPDVPALDLLSTVLGDGRSSRLYRRVREEAGLAYRISAFSYTPGDPGLFGIDATLDPKKREVAEQLVLHILDEVKQAGVTAEELIKAKKISLSHHLGALTTMRGQASDIGSNWLLTRNLNFSRDYLDAVQKVTLDDIKRVAAHYLTNENLTVISLNPKGSLLPKAGTAKPISAGEVQKFELSNGLRLLVREDARLPLVAVGAVFRSGLLAETPQTNGITRLMAKALLKGTTTRTAEQIANEIEAVGGSMSSEASNNTFNVSLEVTKPDVKLAVELLSDVLLNAIMPEKAIAREKEIQLAAIKQEEEQMTTVARNILRQALFTQHPYALRANGSVDSVQRLTQKDLLEFRDRYVVAKNGVDEASSDLGSRFFIRIREQMGLAYYVGASQMEGLVPGLFAFYLGTDPQKIEPVKIALLDEIRKLATNGLTNEELARAKKKLIGQQEIANQSNDSFGYQCALDELYGLGFNYYKSLQHNVEAVSLDDIKRVAAKYFRDQPYVLATVRPPDSSAAANQK